ncbi:ABC transporter ATP-binding protein [bacterium]|nr:ABC transporter ATP-binding protein [bacterium]
MADYKIQTNNVTKWYQSGETRFVALAGVTLNIASGEFTGLIGPSGSGKTTLLNLIGGLDSPSEGEVKVDDWELNKMTSNQLSDFRNDSIGFIFQSYNLLPVYTAYENVEFPLLLQRERTAEDNHKAVTNILKRVGLGDKMQKRPSALSGGECQRVAIARAMVKNPSLVLADEPTANLDSENSHEILKIMKELNQEFGTTFVFSTHDIKVKQYLKRIVVLTDGKVVEDRIAD